MADIDLRRDPGQSLRGDKGMNTPVVLITGALTGIGRATALAFAQEGSHVVISGRREDAGRDLVTELRALGVEAEFVRADVRREDDVRNFSRQDCRALWSSGCGGQQRRYRRAGRAVYLA